MCGIMGYTGSESAPPRILAGLKALAYRGYDSAGLGAVTGQGVRIVKAAGRVENLEAEVLAQKEILSTCGIGHTRWATHGAPTVGNAHPHRVGRVTLVHNGIIENEGELRRELRSQGITFSSRTDTEVAAAVIDRCYSRTSDPVSALRRAEKILRGAYAFGVLFDGRPGEIYALRRQSPLLVAFGPDGAFLASDLPAILPYTKARTVLEEGDLAVLTPNEIRIFAPDGREVFRPEETFDSDPASAEKGGWNHFMEKEIYEQPEAFLRTVLPRVRDGLPHLSSDGFDDGLFRSLKGLRIVACGTAMHAGLAGKGMIESLARVPVTVEIASEFRYSDPILSPEIPVICVSQSGETADTLAALRLAKSQSVPVFAIVNVKGSALAREADGVFYTHAGPEIAVASTKAYTVQLAAFALLALRLALVRGVCSADEVRGMTGRLCRDVPSALKEALAEREGCRRIAKALRDRDHLFFLGRGVDYALSMEGSLKLKEISYIHSEAYAAGELKHGTISLITDGTPVIVAATDPRLFDKTVGSLREAMARGGRIYLLASPRLGEVEGVSDRIVLPDLPPFLAPFASIVCLQCIAYETAVLRGCDVDRPRNLAKSVTVE